MAASFNESQKIDYLWKKVGYGVTKTAEPASKEAFNESIASPLLYRGDLIWTQSGDIPASPPASTTSLVQVYKDGGGAGYSPTVQCTEDLTAPDNQTWKTNLINWIPTQFGDNYLVQVYAGAANISNPQTAGTKLFGAGSGSDDTWFFDYQSGVLNFNGATIPTAIGTGTANTIYIVGYRYVGEYGVDTTFISNGTSNVNIATANGNITMGVNGTGNVAVISNTGAYVSGVVSASGNVTGNYFIGNGSQLTGVSASSVNANALIGNTLSSNVLYSSLTSVGTLSNVSVAGNVVGGNVITAGLISATADITSAANIVGGNVTTVGQVSATGNIQGGNVLTAGVVSATANVTGGNVLTGGLISATATITSASNITGGNVLTGGVVSATGNATFGNIGTAGNISGANVISATTFTASGNVTGGNILTVGAVSATGNIQGNVLIGNGAGLTSLTGANVTGTVANANYALNANSATYADHANIADVANSVSGGNVSGQVGNALIAGTVYTNAQPNITSVGTLTSLSSSGNITGGNLLTGGLISATSTITSAANITGGNVLTGGVVSATGNVTGGGVITTGPSGNISGANVISATTFTASGNVTGGNILTVGLVSATGNVFGNSIRSDNYCYANGVPIPTGIVYTAAASPPAGPDVADQWYDTTSDVLYEYINDGTSSYWVDTTSPAFAGGVVANVAISGTLVPVANVTYDVGTSSVYFRNTYTQNLYTNNRLPAYNMPVGAVVQTVMSSSLGGSITNSGSYVDVTYANVTITPSSANSRVLILATGTSDFSAVVGSGISADTQLVRSPSTSLQIQTVATSGTGGVGASGAISYSYLDAPGTTGAVTYKLQQRVSNTNSTLTSTNIWLIAQEIAAS